MSLSDIETREIEGRLLAAEQEIRALRVTLQLVTACSCPVGFGSQPDPGCLKHGSRAR